jgi:hypothetical protein
LGLSEERSWFEIFSSEKAGYPFRRSETRLFAEFAPFRHPRAKLLLSRRPCASTGPAIRRPVKTHAHSHSADQRSAARQEPRPPRSSPAFSQNFRESQRHWASARRPDVFFIAFSMAHGVHFGSGSCVPGGAGVMLCGVVGPCCRCFRFTGHLLCISAPLTVGLCFAFCAAAVS